jgi:hypothetical protein
MTARYRTLLCVMALGAALAPGCDSCKKGDPKPAADAAKPAISFNIAPSAPSTVAALPPGGFKPFFPKENVVFSSSKEGFAEGKLSKDGNEVAILTIIDAERLAYAKAKFDTATEKLEGFPVLKTAPNQSSVLVRERFQVKVQSQTLDHEARKAILATFDLKGLAGT